jgi:hypothetical protein
MKSLGTSNDMSADDRERWYCYKDNVLVKEDEQQSCITTKGHVPEKPVSKGRFLAQCLAVILFLGGLSIFVPDLLAELFYSNLTPCNPQLTNYYLCQAGTQLMISNIQTAQVIMLTSIPVALIAMLLHERKRKDK